METMWAGLREMMSAVLSVLTAMLTVGQKVALLVSMAQQSAEWTADQMVMRTLSSALHLADQRASSMGTLSAEWTADQLELMEMMWVDLRAPQMLVILEAWSVSS